METLSPQAVLALILDQQLVETPEPLTTETDLFACGLDSLAMMQLLLHLERHFGVRLPPAEMTRERFTTATSLAAWVAAQPSSVTTEA